MRNYFFNMSLIGLSLVSVSAYSAPIAKDAIPQKILDEVYKKHPNAADIAAEQINHFNQGLFEIKFKDGEEQLIKFYRENGRFFVDGVKIDTSENTNMLPSAGNENLKTTFPKYDITDAVLVVNPNGVGEEFDLIVNSEGVDWHITLDAEGKIVKKERD
ncbi:MAG: hypothetical protein HOP23_06105 [Methylococcaceae bacterium]|nr:hypothetical protein [Methylococcaceae bacterium]